MISLPRQVVSISRSSITASASGNGDYPDGSAIGTCEEVVDDLLTRGEKLAVLKVRLYRPFSAKHLLQALPDPYAAWRYWTEPKNPVPRQYRSIWM